MKGATGMLTVKELEELADAGEIDTVLCMFTDFQGRFVGKRILPYFFLEEVLGEEGLHACLYLIAIDMEMEPLPGFEFASWETGYGDFKMNAAVGAFLGWKLLPLVILLSSAVGLVFGAAQMFAVRGRWDGGFRFHFGPYIAIAGVITLFWGEPIVRWYLQRL